MRRVRITVNVDGRIGDADRAVVPVLDHGFLFGDSVYEVLWWHRGALIQAADHWERLEASARRVHMDLQHDRAALEAAVRATLEASGAAPGEDAWVRVIVTRGVGALALDPATSPRRGLVVIVAPAHRPTPEAFERGVHLSIVERRRNSPRALDPRVKTGNYLNNVLALTEARQGGADDALLLNDRGEVAEATTSNVYLVRGGVLTTPELAAGILEGTTRRRLLALCGEEGIPAREARVTPADLAAADELFLSSSVRGLMPVTRLDGRTVGDGRAGPLTRRLRDLFEAAAHADAARTLGAPAT
jgi:branched-chain amino acid aminotransferase